VHKSAFLLIQINICVREQPHFLHIFDVVMCCPSRRDFVFADVAGTFK